MSRIALILGCGKGIGTTIADGFHSAGYRVASVSRTPRSYASDDRVHLTADFADPSSIEPLFEEVEKRWGNAPDVVIYNAYAGTPTRTNPLEVAPDAFVNNININTTSAYSAAFIAHKRNNNVKYIYTGNALNNYIDPNITLLGVGKSASAHWIQAAAKAEGFYYCDQRRPDGSPCYTGLRGDAHGELYLKLAESREQGEPVIVFRA
ncbi:hypothetical protein I302_101152 [Kwoniella bestiolae CBS 10118]|uniref:Short-chain dehydrogenase n=1 Tax=Kwoniella bestiolae CBS 10118 TaxID=1296100 RepID=A0AAJ8K1A9_9TREE